MIRFPDKRRILCWLVAIVGLPDAANAGIYTATPDGYFSWAAFGFSFAFTLTAGLIATLCFRLVRGQLVLHPGVTTRRYAASVVVLAAFYIVTTLFENTVLAPSAARLPLEALPLAVLVQWLHARAYASQEPAELLAGMSLLLAGAIVGVVCHFTAIAHPRPGQWVALFIAFFLTAYTLGRNARSKRAFFRDTSAVVANRLPTSRDPRAGKPWYSLAQTVAVVFASVAGAVFVQLAAGQSLRALLFVDIFTDAAFILGITAAASLLPALWFRLRQRQRLPDFVWLVWLIWGTATFGSAYLQMLYHR
jgi:hypothetical protein